MSSFDFEIWLFNPTLTTSPFSKDDKTAGFACSVGNSSYIQSKKQPNQQLNCIEVVQIWAEGCIGHYPIQKHFLGFGWEVAMALLCLCVCPAML